MDYKLAPTDITYAYEDCKRCFVLKVKRGIDRPSIRFPQVFGKIGALQDAYYAGRRTEEFCRDLPPGVVKYGEKWVECQPIRFPDRPNGCFIRGRFDIVVDFDDGGYGVIDFKTREPAEEPTAMYGRQLHAYAHCLENPAPGKLSLSPVKALGLLYFGPNQCDLQGARQILSGPLMWVEVPRDDAAFTSFLRDVVDLLDGDLPEPQTCERCPRCSSGGKCDVKGYTPAEKLPCICCPWCLYRAKTTKMGV